MITLVPPAGVEPACPCGRAILSRVRLPFRHRGLAARRGLEPRSPEPESGVRAIWTNGHRVGPAPGPGLEPGRPDSKPGVLPITPTGIGVEPLLGLEPSTFRLRDGCSVQVSLRGRCASSGARESNAVCPDPKSGGSAVSLAPGCPPGAAAWPWTGAGVMCLLRCGVVNENAPFDNGRRQAPAEGVEPSGNGFGGRSASESSPARN